MTDHDYMVGIAESVLHGKPVPGFQWRPNRKRIRDETYDKVMSGQDCTFYFDDADPCAHWSNEQELALMQAVKLAASLIGADDAQRWRIVQRELARQATTYADDVAEKA